MNKFNVIALANTFAIIDIILHPIFHIWVYFAPKSYENIMNLFVAGLNLQVTQFDISLSHIIFGTVIEAGVFWVLGVTAGLLYNKLSK